MRRDEGADGPNEVTRHPRTVPANEVAGEGSIDRRAALKAFVGLGLASGLADCTSAAEPRAAPSPPSGGVAAAAEPGVDPAPPGQPEQPLEDTPGQPPEADTTPPEEHEHPADGDVLVFAFGGREGQVIAPFDVPLGGPQVFAYPADAGGGHVASDSRLNQVMLVRMDPSSLTDETAARAVDGIVAYSAVCTHEGCDVSDWNEDALQLVCPCHDSEFDPSDNGQVTDGPARRRLASLPLRIVDGRLTAGGGFLGRIGFRRR